MDQSVSIDGLQFKILAPSFHDVPRKFLRCRTDSRLRESLLADVQLIRGAALSESVPHVASRLRNGRHVQAADEKSWHVLLQNSHGVTLGCARYRHMSDPDDQFDAANSAIGLSHSYGPILQRGLDELACEARARNKFYGEAGGWALRREIRGSTAAVSIALMTFALAEHMKSAMAITTATRMHHSSSMLCRIGATRLKNVPAYYDSRFGSIIEILHFELPNKNPLYAGRLNKLRSAILETPIICPDAALAYQQPEASSIDAGELLLC